MDWQQQLASFLNDNPDLPEGPGAEEAADSVAEQEMRQPRLDVGIEKKGRGGKTATLITGWVLPDERVSEIASQLKQRLGAGGSARGGDILIQGDRRRDVVELLKAMGFKARII